jgi:hypothetical protein
MDEFVPVTGLPKLALGHGRDMTNSPDQSPPEQPSQTEDQLKRLNVPDRDAPDDKRGEDFDPGPDPSGKDRDAYPRRREATTSEEAMAPEREGILEESAYTSAHRQLPDEVVDRQSTGDVSVHDPEGERHVAKANESLDE